MWCNRATIAALDGFLLSIKAPAQPLDGRIVAQNSSKTITYADAGMNIDQANRT